MVSQTAGRRCYIELDLNTDDSVLKTESVSKDFFSIIQKLQTVVTWIEVTKTGKSRPSEDGKNRILSNRRIRTPRQSGPVLQID